MSRGLRHGAAGRRITETASGSTTHLYYSASWQVLEERLDTSSNAHAQYVWGLGYVNDLVLRDRDADSDSGTGSLGKSSSGLEERLYAQQDANYNVTSLTNTSGTVVEQYQYDPYGKVTYMDGSWGGIGSSAKGWQYLFQGGRQDAATGDVYFEHRDYDVDQGRWKTADPLGYPDGGNRYEMVRSSPLVAGDPEGEGLLKWIYTGRWNATDEEYAAATDGAGEYYLQNAGDTHRALQAIASRDPTFLADAVDAALEDLEGDNLHNEVMKNRGSPNNIGQKVTRGIEQNAPTVLEAAIILQIARDIQSNRKPCDWNTCFIAGTLILTDVAEDIQGVQFSKVQPTKSSGNPNEEKTTKAHCR